MVGHWHEHCDPLDGGRDVIGRTPLILVWVTIIVVFLMLGSSQCARASIPCDVVVQYAAAYNIPNTQWGRVRARIIAATFGIRLTDEQLSEVMRCLALPKNAGATAR